MDAKTFIEDIFTQSEEMKTQNITLETAAEWLQEWFEEWDIPNDMTAETLWKVWNQLAQEEREYIAASSYHGAPIFQERR